MLSRNLERCLIFLNLGIEYDQLCVCSCQCVDPRDFLCFLKNKVRQNGYLFLTVWAKFFKASLGFHDTLCSLGQYLNLLETCLVVGLSALPGA